MFDAKAFIKEKIKEIQDTIGDKKAVVAVSGGVDSTVTCKLAWQALKSRQLKVFTLDDGLRREGEPMWVVDTFNKLGIPVTLVENNEDCFRALKGMDTGEKKRIAYSNWFGKLCGRISHNFNAFYVFFGSNALDSEETGGGAQKQHNAWEAMGIDTQKEFGFKVVEPIKELYKNKIREVAWALEIPFEITERMPFPGPGLSIRVMGEVTPEKVRLVKKCTAIVEEILKPLKPFQCLAYLMLGQTTGIREDGKGFFGHIISIRSVESQDGRTASVTWIPTILQNQIIERILSELPVVARVVFDHTPKPPGRIEYE